MRGPTWVLVAIEKSMIWINSNIWKSIRTIVSKRKPHSTCPYDIGGSNKSFGKSLRLLSVNLHE